MPPEGEPINGTFEALIQTGPYAPGVTVGKA